MFIYKKNVDINSRFIKLFYKTVEEKLAQGIENKHAKYCRRGVIVKQG